MKISKMVVRAVCDLCNDPKENCFSTCLGCGIDICFSCEKNVCKTMHKDVYSTSVQTYCPDCREDNKILSSDLYKALQAVESLKLERAGFYKDFEERASRATNHLANLLEGKGKHEQSN